LPTKAQMIPKTHHWVSIDIIRLAHATHFGSIEALMRHVPKAEWFGANGALGDKAITHDKQLYVRGVLNPSKQYDLSVALKLLLYVTAPPRLGAFRSTVMLHLNNTGYVRHRNNTKYLLAHTHRALTPCNGSRLLCPSYFALLDFEAWPSCGALLRL
jgi:hypothetical protein